MNELPISGTKRIVMQKATFKQKEYWQIGNQWRTETNPEWLWKTSINIPIEKGQDLAKVLRNFADAIEGK